MFYRAKILRVPSINVEIIISYHRLLRYEIGQHKWIGLKIFIQDFVRKHYTVM